MCSEKIFGQKWRGHAIEPRCGSYYLGKFTWLVQREQQQQETHFKVMRLLDEDPSISTREIAKKVGISNGAAYYCVTALVEKGFVKLKNFTQSKTKANYIYELTPRGIRAKAALTVSFLERKRHEYEDLKLEIERLESELGVDDKDGSPATQETLYEFW